LHKRRVHRFFSISLMASFTFASLVFTSERVIWLFLGV